MFQQFSFFKNFYRKFCRILARYKLGQSEKKIYSECGYRRSSAECDSKQWLDSKVPEGVWKETDPTSAKTTFQITS